MDADLPTTSRVGDRHLRRHRQMEDINLIRGQSYSSARAKRGVRSDAQAWCSSGLQHLPL